MEERTKINVKGHHNRPDLVGEHKYGDAAQVILLIVFLGVWVLDSFVFHWTDFLRYEVSLTLRIIVGSLILIASFILARKSLAKIFGEVRDEPTLIREGLFDYVRHPVYLSAILLYPGLIVFTLSLASAGVWLVIILLYMFLCRYEEQMLIRQFGNAYIQYKKEVPMLIPRLKK
jgi:methanethiol S-methyltransferase